MYGLDVSGHAGELQDRVIGFRKLAFTRSIWPELAPTPGLLELFDTTAVMKIDLAQRFHCQGKVSEKTLGEIEEHPDICCEG